MPGKKKGGEIRGHGNVGGRKVKKVGGKDLGSSYQKKDEIEGKEKISIGVLHNKKNPRGEKQKEGGEWKTPGSSGLLRG